MERRRVGVKTAGRRGRSAAVAKTANVAIARREWGSVPPKMRKIIEPPRILSSQREDEVIQALHVLAQYGQDILF